MSDDKTSEETANITSPTDIDKIIHEPARLTIMAHLYIVESQDMVFLKNQTGLTWGNISSHVSKLEEEGYVNIEKGYQGKRPQTILKLTEEGRRAFKQYKEKLNKLIGEID
jgi:DNA-binding MarR family transcriptional regulator